MVDGSIKIWRRRRKVVVIDREDVEACRKRLLSTGLPYWGNLVNELAIGKWWE